MSDEFEFSVISTGKRWLHWARQPDHLQATLLTDRGSHDLADLSSLIRKRSAVKGGGTSLPVGTHLNETSSSISPLPRCDLLLVLFLADDGVDLILLALGGLVDTPLPLLFSEQEDWCLRRLKWNEAVNA